MIRKCRVVVEGDDGQFGVCGGEIEYWRTVYENKGKDRKISLYRCNKCGLIYFPTNQ